MSIDKRSFKMGFSWEALLSPRKGHLKKTGIPWVQKIGWLWERGLYAIYVSLETRLNKSRHFWFGYEWGDHGFEEFRQKERWVEDDSNTE